MYATPSPIREAKNAVAAIQAVTMIALTGTPLELSLAKNLGASPLLAICCSVLDALYIEELPQESTEVRITAFIRDAAANPALWKMMVNGDAATLSSAASSSVGSVNGISVPTTKIVPR